MRVFGAFTLRWQPAAHVTGPVQSCGAMGSPNEVSGAAHVGGRTLLRLEGVAPSIAARVQALRELLKHPAEELGTLDSRALWRDVRDARMLPADGIVWRISCAPTDGPAIVARIRAQRPADALYDWSGGLIWLALPPSADADHALVRGALSGGHATLIRAPEAVRAALPVFQPQSPALAALSARVKESFDPKGLFNPGRMG